MKTTLCDGLRPGRDGLALASCRGGAAARWMIARGVALASMSALAPWTMAGPAKDGANAPAKPAPNAPADAEPKWQSLPLMPEGVLTAAASAAGRRAVISGGINQAGLATPTVQVYDVDAAKWTTPVRLAIGRCFHAQVTLPDGRVFVAGGQSGYWPGALRAESSCELIDLTHHTTAPAPPLPKPADEPTAHVLPDGRVVVVGAHSASVLDVSGPAARWVKHIDLRRPRSAHASLLLPDGRVLVAGGVNQDTFELIDVEKGVSQQLAATLPFVNDDLRLVPLPEGRVWVIGGQNSRTGRTTDQTWVLDLNDATRAALARGPALGVANGVADASVAVAGPWALVAGGESDQNDGDVELTLAFRLDTRTLDVHPLPATTLPCDDAVALAFGRSVIVFGGYYRQANPLLPKVPIPVASRAVSRMEFPD
jgi:hypothetical protein